MLRFRSLGIFAVIFSVFAPGASACEDCLATSRICEKMEKGIHRLNDIIRINEEFIAGLDEGDDSERLKARSNVNIAKKRVSASDGDLRLKRLELETPGCKKCLSGENKNGS